MSTRKSIDILSIRGFRSFRELDSFELRSLNVLIGSNGSGKSNFISFFRLLHELAEKRLNAATGKAGGADSLLYRGRKHTSAFEAELYFGLNGYRFTLEPTVADRFVFTREEAYFKGPYFGPKKGPYFGPKTIRLGSGHEGIAAERALEKGGRRLCDRLCIFVAG
jgi:predicted ATPase